MYLIYRLGNLALSCSKLPKTKDAWTLQFECMHGVVGPRSLVEGQHVELQGIGSSGYAWNCRSQGSMHKSIRF